MKAKCVKCSKLFEVKTINKVVMICPECESIESKRDIPDILRDIFNPFNKGGDCA